MAETKVPDASVVEKAAQKMDAGEELNQRETAALEAQAQIDQERGYRRIEWKPGVFMLQHIATQHTTLDTEGGELDMRKWDNEYRTSQLRG